MALNEVFRDADHLSLPVPEGTKSGDPVRVGGLNGVALTDAADTGATPDPVYGPAVNLNADGNASVALKGAFSFTVSFAVSNVGDPIYMDADGHLTANAQTGTGEGAVDNDLYGHALNTKSSSSGTLIVRLAN
jgi:predicted RecA/RadA family phage recombinase